ncbi:hypothetical protein [Planomonospora algeriensis]
MLLEGDEVADRGRLDRREQPYLGQGHGRSGGRDRAGADVYNRIHWGVVTYVATYRRRMRPQVLDKIQRFAGDKQVVFLRGRRQTRRWLEQVAAWR